MREHLVIRPVRQDDLEDVLALAKQASPGLTNLLPDKKLIQEKIDWSMLSFEKKLSCPEHELYFFVMEDVRANKIVGTCGIFSDVGDDFYSFRVSRELYSSDELKIKKENLFLELVNDYQHVSELGLLLINKHYRKKKLGKFLSRSRYLFIADNLERFHPHIIAEMRGAIDFWGKSVFWDAVGSKFIEITFSEADYLSATKNKHFISELMPHGPIPVSILPAPAQKAIGTPHADTAAAVAVLLSEGFEYSRYVDIFDGGPTLEGVINNLKTVNESRLLPVSKVEPIENGHRAMVSFRGEDYRICRGSVLVINNQEIILSPSMAQLLNCQIGDLVRVVLDS